MLVVTSCTNVNDSSNLSENEIISGYVIPVSIDEKYGFINEDGEYIVEPVYTEVSQFSEGLACVAVGEYWAYGYIDMSGKMVIDPIYNLAYPFSEGYAVVQLEGSSRWGLIDPEGNWVLEPIYAKMTSMYEGTIIVTEDLQHFMILNSNFNEVGSFDIFGGSIEAGEKVQFPALINNSGSRSGELITQSGDSLGLVDSTSGFFKTSIGNCAMIYSDTVGLCLINEDGKILNSYGETNHVRYLGFQDDKFYVNLYGNDFDGTYVFDCSGNVDEFVITFEGNTYKCVLDNITEDIVAYSLDLTGWHDGGYYRIKWGYASINGESIIEPKYDEAGPFKDEYAIVSIGDIYGLINRDGDYIVSPVYSQMYDIETIETISSIKIPELVRDKRQTDEDDAKGTQDKIEYNHEEISSFFKCEATDLEKIYGRSADTEWDPYNGSTLVDYGPKFQFFSDTNGEPILTVQAIIFYNEKILGAQIGKASYDSVIENISDNNYLETGDENIDHALNVEIDDLVYRFEFEEKSNGNTYEERLKLVVVAEKSFFELCYGFLPSTVLEDTSSEDESGTNKNNDLTGNTDAQHDNTIIFYDDEIVNELFQLKHEDMIIRYGFGYENLYDGELVGYDYLDESVPVFYFKASDLSLPMGILRIERGIVNGFEIDYISQSNFLNLLESDWEVERIDDNYVLLLSNVWYNDFRYGYIYRFDENSNVLADVTVIKYNR